MTAPWREPGADPFGVLFDLFVELNTDRSAIGSILDLVERERPGWLAEVVERRRAERAAHAASVQAAPPSSPTAGYHRQIERWAAEYEPRLGEYREAVIEAATAYEPEPMEDPSGPSIRVLLARDGSVEVAGEAGQSWADLYRGVVRDWAEERRDVTAAELADSFGELANLRQPAEDLARLLASLRPVVMLGDSWPLSRRNEPPEGLEG